MSTKICVAVVVAVLASIMYKIMRQPTLPAFAENVDTEYDYVIEYHAKGGLLKIDVPRTNRLSDILLEGGKEMGYPETDPNGEKMIGFSKTQSTQGGGVRSSSSRAFLHPILERKNLHVAIYAHVSQILTDNRTAVGVEFTRHGASHTVRAKQEVILSAGAIGSPHILMLSGIGPKEHLENLGIPVKEALPVGDNLQDHVFLDIGFRINTTDGLRSLNNVEGFLEYLKYSVTGTGMLTSPHGVETLAFLASTESNRKSDWPDVQLLLSSFLLDWGGKLNSSLTKENAERLKDRSVGHGVTCMTALLRPASVGTLRLRSKDPEEHPVIDPHYLEKPEDVDVILYGVEACRNLMNTPSLQKIGAKLVDKPLKACLHEHDFDSDNYWRCVIRYAISTVYHPVGTCKMGRVEDPTTVVDSQLR